MKNKKRKLKKLLITISAIGVFVLGGVFTFFHTNVFAKQRDLWVQTAMSTSNHKWLATTFLSSEEIEAILAKYTVVNSENSDSASVKIQTAVSTSSSNTTTSVVGETSLKEISGSTYQGYVVTVKDPSKVSLTTNLDSLNQGQLVSETLAETASIQAIVNAGGFDFNRQSDSSVSTINSGIIQDGQLIYGSAEEETQWIGMSKEGKLILGTYTFKDALAAGIDDAIEFGPYLLINGEDQIENEETGGLQPRTAIGQSSDGTIFLVVIEGRSTSSAGASLYDLQEIMKDLGVINAANLDGGGSSELFYEGNLINDLSNGSERAVTTVFTVEK